MKIPSSSKATKILVADILIDAPASSLRATYESFGFDVLGARSDEEAIRILERAGEGEIAACFIDCQVPTIDGLAFAAAVKKIGNRTPIFIVSSGVVLAHYARSLGVRAWIQKPLGESSIQAVIDFLEATRRH